jgi:predicted nucleic-acid-binding Zn-ribbon protein
MENNLVKRVTYDVTCKKCGGTLFYIDGIEGKPIPKIGLSKCWDCGSSDFEFSPITKAKRKINDGKI